MLVSWSARSLVSELVSKLVRSLVHWIFVGWLAGQCCFFWTLARPLLRGAGGYGSLQPSQHVLVSWPRMTELAAAKMLATTWVIMPLFIPPIYHRRLTEPRLNHTKLIEVDVCNQFLQYVYCVVCVCARCQSWCILAVIPRLQHHWGTSQSCKELSRPYKMNPTGFFHCAESEHGMDAAGCIVWICTKVCNDVIVQRYWVPWFPMRSVGSIWRNWFNGFWAARNEIVSI